MKKLIITVATAGLCLMPAVGVSANDVNATTSGPNSGVDVGVVSDTNCSVDISNDVEVTHSNDQSVGSGDATTTDNTGAGSTTTGDASATNTTDISLGVSNSSCSDTEVSTPEPSPTPVGGQGAGTPAVLAATATKVATLPDTGNAGILTTAIFSAVVGTLLISAGTVLYLRRD